MADFEDKYVYAHPKQPLVWVRFIDDIFYIWQHGQKELDIFIKHFNSVHDTIEFTSEISTNSVNFLDTVVRISSDYRIETSLVVKPTDSASCLHFDSAHPRHGIRGIPYGQFLRIRRICSDDQDFFDHCVTKGRHFVCRGYPAPFIANAFYKASEVKRDSLLTNKGVKDNQTVPNILSQVTPRLQRPAESCNKKLGHFGKILYHKIHPKNSCVYSLQKTQKSERLPG